MTELSTFAHIRQHLDQAEREIVAMRQQPSLAAQVILHVERAEALLRDLGQQTDVRAETQRATTLREQLFSRAEQVVKLVIGAGNQAALADSSIWQALRQTATDRRSRARRRLMLAAASVVIVALLVFVVLPRVFPVPPVANTMLVGQLAAQGDYEAAYRAAVAEQAAAPNDPVIGVWITALGQQTGQLAAGEASWAEARARYNGDDVAFLNDRVIVLLTLGDLAAAEQDALALGQLPEGAAAGAYHLGGIRETQGRYADAIAAFEQASSLGEQSNNPQLTVAARTRIAALLQRVP